LFDLSLRKWRGLAAELDFNVMFTPCGHLHLASTKEELDRFAHHQRAHAAMGVRTQLLDRKQTLERAPALNPAVVAGSIFQADAGTAHHDGALWGYAQAAARRGVEIHPWTTVTGFTTHAARVRDVETTRGTISTRSVVIACGGFSRDVAALAGVRVPTVTIRLEALVTESLKPFIRPVLGLKPTLAYCRQTTRGEVVGGSQLTVMEACDRTGGSLRGLRDMCQKLVAAVPALSAVRVVRYWAGLAELTPDVAPVIGPAPGVDGLWLSAGWTYGFMAAPGAGLLMAEAVDRGETPEVMKPFSLERLLEGRYIAESAVSVVPLPSEAT
jgi:sarcosine oxidase subunit beta